VKFFADGVVENETGALLAPYCSGLHSHSGGAERSGSGDNLGMRNWEGDSLAEAACRVDALGLQIHIHAIGDAAVRQALDAIEHVVAQNGSRDRRPVIAHCQLVDDADLARFAEFGVIPNMQPLWAQLDALMTVLTIPRLGRQRADKQYPIRTLDTSGAPLGFGSDWPVSSGAPLDGIAVATSRRTAAGDPDGGWTPHEILPIERALSAYTEGVANQAFAERRWGVIGPGASGDLVWLHRDPRTTPPLDLPRVGVRATYLRGAQAYRAEN
jgi:predicted amidohydrolase YtcJ